MQMINNRMTETQIADLFSLAVQLQVKAEESDDRDTAILAYSIQNACSNLTESQREFRAADATIHNLELKLTDMAVQLANAESKCRELAAELSAVDKIHNEAVFITDDHYEQCPPEVQKMIRSLAVLQIPAYDAFLAEVRASAIPDEATERDLFEEWVMEKICISKTTLEGLRTDDGYRNSTLSGTDYNGMWSQWKAIRAAQLRKGAAL
ncbi:hypothetical protein LMI98_22080 [Escherichia coli]|uniref:hypothetical protein n=1 Tax=Escherichia coli TaxID=562 RepID=UPI001E447D53|nr:hypothetical protein [Escherichia coli]MCC5020610.1 hypothetical protein [Escherichia coli]